MVNKSPAAAAPLAAQTQLRFYHGKQVATRDELEAQRIVDRAVFLADLPRIDNVDRDKRFESCVFVGPGIVALSWLTTGNASPTSNVLSHCSFDAHGEYDLCLEVPEKTAVIRGTVLLEGCTIRYCDFVDIGFIGPATACEMIRKAIEERK
jgi:hypothetical protein